MTPVDATDSEIERLHLSIDGLTGAVSGLKDDARRQAEKIETFGERQTSDFKDLITRLHDNHAKLLDRQESAFKSFADRLDRLLAKQEEQASAIRGEMRTDFARIVDRQDSHFRWLVGIIVAAAMTVALASYRMH